MKIKTTELQGEALDWAVAKCEVGDAINEIDDPHFYSTDWALAGPIIERDGINVFMDDEKWAAYASHSLPQNFYGTSTEDKIPVSWKYVTQNPGSPLVAAMRCYVASVLGDEVEVPKELEGGSK
jgi:hypothetical protein